MAVSESAVVRNAAGERARGGREKGLTEEAEDVFCGGVLGVVFRLCAQGGAFAGDETRASFVDRVQRGVSGAGVVIWLEKQWW